MLCKHLSVSKQKNTSTILNSEDLIVDMDRERIPSILRKKITREFFVLRESKAGCSQMCILDFKRANCDKTQSNDK